MCRHIILTAASAAILWSQPPVAVDSVGADGSRSLAYYESVLKKYPDMPEARFGAGHAAYLEEDYERASLEFKSVAGVDENDLRSKSYYNLGNTLHQQGMMEESLSAFRKSLELNPGDLDAKYNYEFTKRLMEQMQQQQQPDQSGQEQKDDSAEEQQQQQQQAQDQAGQDPSQGESKQQENRPQQSQPQPQEQGGAEQREKPDAETILNALKADEENLMKRLLSLAKSKKREKDW
ncbi:MAG: tetratricopeptide repeat protein [Candidatus Marinimicrobia bacterium]|nr:tetratricopeptide repeat protein [Candidatus Neomarinimicrobiota bacterium]MDP6592878.1 tetratricopeptide repeat protein [Candidatus Neomarinimicrobiota bacterium]MDP6836151.1 tetratricopeptide repeat protein [Candidatus Neomarinimicrobiota bacterium]MDP6967168.1 tetratricopeptide repeat protein [Candidatus Neomarinimicrobiota bacterium]